MSLAHFYQKLLAKNVRRLDDVILWPQMTFQREMMQQHAGDIRYSISGYDSGWVGHIWCSLEVLIFYHWLIIGGQGRRHRFWTGGGQLVQKRGTRRKGSFFKWAYFIQYDVKYLLSCFNRCQSENELCLHICSAPLHCHATQRSTISPAMSAAAKVPQRADTDKHSL